MEIRTLEYFLMVAREENITRAARKLHITQPTLSRQLSKLEDELGVTLFTRGQYSITLTEEGELLKRRANSIVQLANSTMQELQKEEVNLSGEISIGCGETVNMRVLAKWMKSFQQMYPDIFFHIQTGTADELIEKLEQGILDMAMVVSPVDISMYNYISMPYHDTSKLLMPENHPLAFKDKIVPKDLKGETIFVGKRKGVQNNLFHWLGEYYDESNVVASFSLNNNTAMMIEEGMGIAFCFDLGFTYPHLVFKEVEPPIILDSILIYKKQGLSTNTQHFIEFIRNTKSE